MTDRKATTVWTGDLKSGSGEVTLDSSGAAGPLSMTFPQRSGEPEGHSSPEELIAAAHATCYSMGLASALAGGGNAPEKLESSAVVTFSMDGGPHISKVALTVVGTVPGISDEDFQKAAEAAKDGCPVSKIMDGNVEITLDASLSS